MKKKATLLNMISGFALQFCSIISGFIIPKLILTYFGSNTNGLVSSINQFLSYISLVEGGVAGVIAANLYAPLVEKDNDRISSVMVTSKRFYNIVGIIFIVYSVLLGIIYPIVFRLDAIYVFSLTIILSMNLFVQYMFSISLKTLLTADKKAYIVSLTQIIIILFNIIFAFISIKIFPSIHIMKLITGSFYFLQPVVFCQYIKKHYNINWKAEQNNNLIKSRWNGFAINLAAFIHNSTDISVLTIFSTFPVISVYSTYVLVTNGLKLLIQSLVSGINPTLGHAYAKKDISVLNQRLDLYEYIVFILTFFLFSMAGLLISPFVVIYTKGISDADYYQPIFGYLIVIAEALYLLKLPHLNLAYSVNKFKEITIPAFIEAIINISISIALVGRFGLIGVAIGTICGMTYRLIFHIYYTTKIIEGRKQYIFYRKFFIFIVSAAIGISLCMIFFPFTEISLFQWIIKAFIYSMILVVLFGLVSILFFRKELTFFKEYLLQKKRNNSV